MKAINPMYLPIALVVGLALLSPFARWYPVNIIFSFAIFGAITYAGSVWIFAAYRGLGDSIFLLKDTMRMSLGTGKIAQTEETSASRLPPLTTMMVGGYDAPAISFSDRDMLIVPTGSLERFGKSWLCFSPTVRLTDARMLRGIWSTAAALGEDSKITSFKAGRKSKSEVRIGLFSGLTSRISTEETMAMGRLLNRSGPLVDKVEKAMQGETANLQELQRMIRATKTRPLGERLKSAVFGQKGTEPTEKPRQGEPPV